MAKKNAPSKSSKRKAASHSTRATTPKAKREGARSETRSAAVAATATTAPTPIKSAAATRPSILRAALPAEAALSFLRDTKGLVSWPLRELSQTLNISREEAER